jgi:hypothetical protein
MAFAPSNRLCSFCQDNQGLISWRSDRICDECWKECAQCGRCKDWYFELKSLCCDGCVGATPPEFVAFDRMEQAIQAASDAAGWWTEYVDPVDVAPWASMGTLQQAWTAIVSKGVAIILILCRLDAGNECAKLSAHAKKHSKKLVCMDIPDSTNWVNVTDILDNCIKNVIPEVKVAGNNIFICCLAGFNRAPFVSTYMVATIEERPVLDVLKEVLDVRPWILGNKHFVLALAKTAAARNELLPEVRETHLGVYQAPGGVYWSNEPMIALWLKKYCPYEVAPVGLQFQFKNFRNGMTASGASVYHMSLAPMIAQWLKKYCPYGVDPVGLQFKNFRDGVTASGASVYHMSLAGEWDGDSFDLKKFAEAASNKNLNLAEESCIGRRMVTDARGNTAEFLVIDCPAVQDLRAEHGLPLANLHITLGFNPYDVHLANGKFDPRG